MVDSFFVNPAKRSKSTARTSSTKRTRLSKNGGNKSRSATVDDNGNDGGHDDEGIHSEDLDSDVSMNNDIDDDNDGISSDSEDEFGIETEADKRRRLAKQYLENLQQEIGLEGVDEYAFDAKDLDREIISRRLKEDVAETKGKIYRFLADSLNLARVNPQEKTVKIIQAKPYGITGVATRYPFAYTTSKDLTLTKWDISHSPKPRIIRYIKGNHRVKSHEEREAFKGHFDEILCVAASSDGKYVVTGGRDRRIVVWAAESLLPLKVFETKDRKGVVMGLVFRRNTNELYASCADLKVRTYNLDQLAQVEILFGHQDEVADIDALGQEKCISVGSRDRTAIIWKIAEETRLTFRGADTSSNNLRSKKDNSKTDPYSSLSKILEGSIDCCSMLDDQLFVTGSDNGNISLWSVNKKKPVYVYREAHGRDESLKPEQVSAETTSAIIVPPPPALPRQITSIHAIPYSDTFFTGSWNGEICVWKLSQDQRSFEKLGVIPGAAGIVNKISVVETGPKDKETFILVAAVSKELRLGRWLKVKGKNGILTAVINRK